MKAIFFDPYLDTIGGGERYVLTLVEYLLGKNWQVDLVWNNPAIKEKLETRLNRNLAGLNFASLAKNPLVRWQREKSYDLSFWLSDGSVPFVFSRKNILHFQVPFHGVGGKSFWNKAKLKRISSVVCNSQFTKKFIDQEFGVCSQVIYPPIDTDAFKFGKKENLILSVGRFSQLLQSKRQDVLIEVFQRMVDEGLSGWQLVLVGGADVGATEYLDQLKRKAEDYPIKIRENLEFAKVKELYGKAKIFWNASGFRINEDKEPEKVEHFGMTIVEAMASGCIPLVVGKGGAKEIIKEGTNGFFWEKEEELMKKTQKLIFASETLQDLSKIVVKSSQKFSKERFCQKFDEII